MFVPSLQIRPTWTGTPLCAYFLLARATTWHAVCAGAEVRIENRPVAAERRPLHLSRGSQSGCKNTIISMCLSSDIHGEIIPLLFFPSKLKLLIFNQDITIVKLQLYISFVHGYTPTLCISSLNFSQTQKIIRKFH